MEIVRLCSAELTQDETSHINIYLIGGFKIIVEKGDELKKRNGFLFISKNGKKESFIRLDSIVNIEIVKTN